MSDDSPPPATDPTAPRRPKGRSLADFRLDDRDTPHGLLPAEEKLLQAAWAGEHCWLGYHRPDEATDDNRLRPDFVRFLALGGDAAAPVHEKGVKVCGGWIDGPLDLEFAEDVRPLTLFECYLDGALILVHAAVRFLNLGGSRVAGIQGDGVRVAGDIFLLNGFEAQGEVRFIGAKVGGQFNCSKGIFGNWGGTALSCDQIDVTGGVLLNRGFDAEGEVTFASAKVGGQFACTGGTFRNRRRASNTDGDDGATDRCAAALNMYRAEIAGTLWLGPAAPPNDQHVTMEGSLDLRDAHAGVLIDSEELWRVATVDAPDRETLACAIALDGFTYGRLAGVAPLDAATRLKWLKRQRPEHLCEDFRPQPFEQLAKVYREMGHARRARDIAVEKEKRRLRRPWRWRR